MLNLYDNATLLWNVYYALPIFHNLGIKIQTSKYLAKQNQKRLMVAIIKHNPFDTRRNLHNMV